MFNPSNFMESCSSIVECPFAKLARNDSLAYVLSPSIEKHIKNGEKSGFFLSRKLRMIYGAEDLKCWTDCPFANSARNGI